MKQLLLLTALFFALNLSAQNISGTDISKDSSIQYIEVTVYYSPAKFFKVEMEAYVIYGKEAENAESGFIQDSNGQKMKFNSRPALLNYLYKAGWEVHTTYPMEHPNGAVIYYLMERRK